ncbi:DUF1499 domain-containing protein [Celeribacter sp.]|uniref:DUF1499 domain-containing protein n=1 Tax=Celeribacter sp. TaxID=1890673 RepID=UPI003A952308
MKPPVLLLVLSLVAIFVALQAYIRLAPVDAARWDVDPFAAPDPGEGGDKCLIDTAMTPQEALGRLAQVAQATARTRLVAGSVEAGRMTYMTRSKLWGFPDFTTIEARAVPTGAQVAILARLRFGKSDLDVNATRVATWRAAAGL